MASMSTVETNYCGLITRWAPVLIRYVVESAVVPPIPENTYGRPIPLPQRLYRLA